MDKRELYNYLCSLENVVQKDDWWCATQCVLCGDSKKNPYKKRLYINCDPTKPDEPVWYKCFNCNACSILNTTMLEAITNGAKYEYVQSLRQINNRAMSDDGATKVNRYHNRKEIPLKFPPLTTKPYLINKYKYMSKERLGIVIPPEDFEKLKIVWSLKDFLGENHIPLHASDVDPAVLEQDYVGITSARNEYIIFRDITNKHKYRWYKYNIFGMYGNLSSFYTIRNAINVMSRDEIHIIAAEGFFDTIGILYHIYDGVVGNNVFLSTCNGAFEEPIKYYFSKGIIGENVIVDCYIDNDTRYDFSKLKRRLAPYVISKSNVKIYHNTLKKDFGYPKEFIECEELLL